MFKHARMVVLLVLLAACARESGDIVPRGPRAPSGQQQSGRNVPPARQSDSAIARLPNLGELFAYGLAPAASPGANRWHPVEVSESHALAGIASGAISLRTPDGRSAKLHYQRHIEHPDGNWTWVGETPEGGAAILTFGEKAVFGFVTLRDRILKVATRGGRVWVVEVDPASFANAQARDLDYLVPRKAVVASDRAAPSPAAFEPIAAAATPGALATIDVVAGYTAGFASAQGGTSQAVTRITNMVDIANMAYANSQIDSRVRLVHTMVVNYPDATDNEDALEKLTGYRSGTGWVTPDPAFNALRAAREQYGGDLVALVRKFQTPQNAGCGIAWMLGADLQAIDASDAPWGYSVVSDGSDLDENDNKTYFCREESMAHELGHNMGQEHNIEDGAQKGAHPYSYGYREATTNGFYTVMAYRLADSQQFPIAYFSNPRVTYQGRPTGVAETADNARSMQQTMPIVAGFRASTVNTQRPPNDINADGRSDILWYYRSQIAYWVMNGASIQSSMYAGDAGAGYSLMTTGDFNGDGAGDFVFSNGSTLRLLINNGSGTGFSTFAQQAGGAWSPFSAIDMNGDRRSDLVWRYGSQVAYWVMNGATIQSSVYAGDSLPGFSAMCVADFNGDGVGDLVFSNGSELRIWVNNGAGTGFTSSTYPAGGLWQPFTAGDVNGDGKGDLIWRYGSQLAVWFMDGNTVLSTAYLGDGGLGFRVVLLSDFTGDGAGDFVFSNGSMLRIWINNGTGSSFAVSSQPASGEWQLFDPNIVD